MPNWNEILDEIKKTASVHDATRRRYLVKLHKLTGRNIILYYSGWLQSPDAPPSVVAIGDNDLTGFMSACHHVEKSKGLDLILHTPGGDLAATESIVNYLKSLFSDIRVIVPQLAMSAGTIMACAARSIVMGKQSSLGPIDPQMGGRSAHGILEEFEQAHQEIKADPSKVAVWQPIIVKYQPTLIGECQKSIKWSKTIVHDLLVNGMLAGDADRDAKAKRIVDELGDHALTLSHARHLSAERCRSLGLVIENLEDDDKLQDAVLSVHHCCMHTLSQTHAVKIIENHNGIAFVNVVQQVVMKST
jgi:ClpP class serine protease